MNQIMCVTIAALVLTGCDGAVDKGVLRVALSNDISQTLTLDARGCVATFPDGKPLQLRADSGGQILIPKGSTFTPECFRNGDKNAGR